MSITLGTTPENLTVVLTKDADFFTVLENADGNWSGTAQIELRFGDIVWSSTIAGADATFNIDADQVNDIITARIQRAKLFYIDGDTEICWALGDVEASG